MIINIDFEIFTKCCVSKMHLFFASLAHKCSVQRLKPTCTKNCVPARNPLGQVVFYAPALARRLRLPPPPKGYGETRALHHISILAFDRAIL